MNQTKAELAKLVGFLAASFPAAKITDQTIEAYIAMLQDVPTGVLKVAIQQCANDSKFFPSLAEIRERVAMISQPSHLNAAEAWEQVMIAMRRDGFYRHPSFTNPVLQRAVEAMDWQALCSSENTIADRAHFMKIYDQLIEREKQDSKLLPNARTLRARLTEANERRQIQGSTATNAQIQRRGSDSI